MDVFVKKEEFEEDIKLEDNVNLCVKEEPDIKHEIKDEKDDPYSFVKQGYGIPPTKLEHGGDYAEDAEGNLLTGNNIHAGLQGMGGEIIGAYSTLSAAVPLYYSTLHIRTLIQCRPGCT